MLWAIALAVASIAAFVHQPVAFDVCSSLIGWAEVALRVSPYFIVARPMFMCAPNGLTVGVREAKS